MSKIDEVLKLKELLDSGHISQDDFDKLKSEIFEQNKNTVNEFKNYDENISDKLKNENLSENIKAIKSSSIKSTIESNKSLIIIAIIGLILIFGIFYLIPSSPKTKFIVPSEGTVLKTTDGGKTWSNLKGSIQDIQFQKVYFMDDNNGYAIGSDGTGRYSTVLKTSDGGTSWIDLLKLNNINFTKDRAYNSLYFTDLNTGYVAGTNGIIIKTNDAGKSWVPCETKTNDSLESLFFTNSNVGYVVIGSSGNILKTVDAGNSWNLIKCALDNQAENVYNELESIYFTDMNTGYVVGEKEKKYVDNGFSRLILKTTDGGNTWNSLLKSEENNVDLERLHFLSFVDSNTGFICSSRGSIMKTNDGGKTWSKNTVGEWFISIHFFDEKTGYVIENNGAIFFTTDGGDTWNKSSLL